MIMKDDLAIIAFTLVDYEKLRIISQNVIRYKIAIKRR